MNTGPKELHNGLGVDNASGNPTGTLTIRAIDDIAITNQH